MKIVTKTKIKMPEKQKFASSSHYIEKQRAAYIMSATMNVWYQIFSHSQEVTRQTNQYFEREEGQNKINNTFHSKYTALPTWANRRWVGELQLSIENKTVEKKNGSTSLTDSVHCQCSCSGILPMTHKALTSHTKLCSCTTPQHTVTGIYSYFSSFWIFIGTMAVSKCWLVSK